MEVDEVAVDFVDCEVLDWVLDTDGAEDGVGAEEGPTLTRKVSRRGTMVLRTLESSA